MKNQTCILQWASLIMQKDVQITNVSDPAFVSSFLFKLDEAYFPLKKMADSYSDILSNISDYFITQIGSNLKSHIDSLNAYKNTMEMWELLLGIAIKGNNRDQNINLIFEMDPSLQAELMGFVSQIIDKFGQGVSQNAEEQGQQESEITEVKEKQILIDLISEHESLKQKYEQLQHESFKQKSLHTTTKNDLESQISQLKLEKLSFFEIISSINGSKIYGDDDITISSSLPQLAKDIVSLINTQRKNAKSLQERNVGLEEQLRQIKKDIRKISDQNQYFSLQLQDNFGKYENQIEKLREENSEMIARETGLLERLAQIEEENYYLMAKANKQNNTGGSGYSEEKKKQEIKMKNNEAKDKHEKSYLEPKIRSSISSTPEKNMLENQIDELKEPSIRNKLQRQISHLQKKVNQLQKQNASLKRANQVLQKSAKDFMEEHEVIVKKYEQDHEELFAKVEKLMNEEIEEEVDEPVYRIQINNIDKIEAEQVVQEKQPQKDKKKNSQNKRLLWQQIVFKMKEIIKESKQSEQALKQTINGLQLQNKGLLQTIKQSFKRPPAFKRGFSKESIESGETPNQIEHLANVQKKESYQFKPSSPKKSFLNIPQNTPVRLSFNEIEEGDDLDEDVGFYMNRLKSNFYRLNSQIVNQFQQKPTRMSIGLAVPQEYDSQKSLILPSILQPQGLNKESQQLIYTNSNQKIKDQFVESLKLIKQQYKNMYQSYESIFSKLSVNSKHKNNEKQYDLIIKQIDQMKSEITNDSQLVQLRIKNQYLKGVVSKVAIWRGALEKDIGDFSKAFSKMIFRQEQQQQESLLQVQQLLSNINQSCSQMNNPIQFLEALSPNQDKSQIQKFYELYSRQKHKNSQLSEQLKLLTSVLLEYRNLLE